MSLTTEQLALLTKLESGLYSLSNLTTPERELITATLRLSGLFTDQQKELLTDWHLPTTPEQVAAANAALPTGTAISARADNDGALWVNADLLTDCMRPGDTYHAIGGVLITLPLTKKTDRDFPITF